MSVKIVIVILLFVAAIGGAVTLALYEGGVEYRDVGQLTGSDYDGERVKVKAQVVDILHDFKPTRFTAIDIPPEGAQPGANARQIMVVYEGDDVPQGLKKAAHVTLTGRYDAAKGVFMATEMQTQCPSRYEGKEITEAQAPQP
jgi:cytochrome c-type biogenesis protein CcmE